MEKRFNIHDFPIKKGCMVYKKYIQWLQTYTKCTQENPIKINLTSIIMFRNKVITFGIIIAIIVVFITGCGGAGIVNEPGPYDDLAQCLTEKGAVLYKTEWCPHCKKQKEAFGNSLRYITMVDCDDEKRVCQEEGITGYPTWIIGGKQYQGDRSPASLGAIAGCKTE
jgi:glutaredoxin